MRKPWTILDQQYQTDVHLERAYDEFEAAARAARAGD